VIIVLAALLLLGVAVIQYLFVLAWGHWTTAGVLSSKRAWLTSLPDLLNRMTRYHEIRKTTPDDWKRLVEKFDENRER